MEAVRAVRAAQAAHHSAVQARDLARLALDRARESAAEAEAAEAVTATAVAAAREQAREALRQWWEQHGRPLTGDDSRADALAEALGAALEQVGEPDAPALATVFAVRRPPTP